MTKMFQLKRSTALFLVFFGVLLTIMSPTPVRADYVTSDIGDVIAVYVFMNYQKPGEAKAFWIEKKSMDIYMGDSPIPASINQSIAESYPDRKDIQLETIINPFREKLVGLRIGESDDFSLTAFEVGLTDPEDPLYQADLFYQVTLLEVLHDAQVDIIPELELTDPLVILAIAIIVGAFIGLFYYHIPQKVFNGVLEMRSDKCSVCGNITDVVCGNIKCKSIICRDCFQKHSKCPNCGGASIQTKNK